MPDPYTIRIFVPYGNPDGLRVIDRMNWTGLGIAFPREDWPKIKQRSEFGRSGVYILIGPSANETDDDADDDLPTVYIGQGDVIRPRIENHFTNKDFWTSAAVFVSNAAGGLNRAHATWLEHALIHRAIKVNQSHLENSTEPQEPQLSEAERADTQAFLREILQILPLIGLNCFEQPKTVAAPMAQSTVAAPMAHSDVSLPTGGEEVPDTIIVPAKQKGFTNVFLGENAWHAIRLSAGKIPKIKYIAVYQSLPVAAITHVAPVAKIEPYGDKGKYRVVFSEPAKPIGPIPFGDAPSGFMQGLKYTTYQKLQSAKSVTDTILKSV
jgi:hypothetical protein